MKETAQQYTQRILSYTEGKEPLAVQAETAKKLDRLIRGVFTSELRKRPAPENWSVSEIIAHLADGEIVGGFRLRLILGSPGFTRRCLRSRSMGNKRTLRETRSAKVGRAVSRAAGSESCAP